MTESVLTAKQRRLAQAMAALRPTDIYVNPETREPWYDAMRVLLVLINPNDPMRYEFCCRCWRESWWRAVWRTVRSEQMSIDEIPHQSGEFQRPAIEL